MALVETVTEPVSLGEGPHWDQEDQVLYFVSIVDHTVNKYVPSTGEHTKAKLDEMPSFIIPIEGKKNHFAVGMNRKVVEIEWDGQENGATVGRTISEVTDYNPDTRLNDAKADPRGRLFSGTIGPQLWPGKFHLGQGSIYRFDADGTAHRLDSGVDVSNGLCWDLEEKAFYYVDSFKYTIRRYDYDVETGDISNPSDAFSLKAHNSSSDEKLTGFFDGMTIDTEGNLWVANFDGSKVLKIDPKKGQLLQTIPIPAVQTTSATFGGPNLDELYVTSGSMNIASGPPAGSTFKVTGIGARGHPNVNVRFD